MDLDTRMARPQRHRLLQGYPAVPLMRPATPSPLHMRGPDGGVSDRSDEGFAPEDLPAGPLDPPHLTVDRSRPLIVGVIPHTQCTPRVEGCGFCTFAHDAAASRERPAVIRSVVASIEDLIHHHPDTLVGRRVAAIYFGGGTANLASVGQLGALFEVIARRSHVADAEVTLEGIPALFCSWFYAPLRWLAELPVRHRRISMGVQTFDPTQLARMGRQAFGDRKTIDKLVRRTHAGGMTVSCDLLFNLPDQTLAAMHADVAQAVALGFDQICIYHLVLFAGLGTPWSRDPALLAALPSQAAAVEHWLALREQLLAAGYVQTTLTNFERRELHASDRRFLYEEASFTPETYDGLGLGPLAVSTFIDIQARRAVKLLRAKRVRALPWSHDDLMYLYDEPDLALLFVTRTLARTTLSRAVYRRLFGRDVVADHGAAIEACVARGLLVVDDASLRLTPRGMFFADAVVGTICAARVAVLREGAGAVHTRDLLGAPLDLNAVLHDAMG